MIILTFDLSRMTLITLQGDGFLVLEKEIPGTSFSLTITTTTKSGNNLQDLHLKVAKKKLKILTFLK